MIGSAAASSMGKAFVTKKKLGGIRQGSTLQRELPLELSRTSQMRPLPLFRLPAPKVQK